MNLFLFGTTLIWSTCLTSSFGFKVKCEPGYKYEEGHFINATCAISEIEVPLQQDRLEVDPNGKDVTKITFLQMRTKEGDIGFTGFPAEIFEILPNLAAVEIESNLEKLSENDWKNAVNLNELKVSRNKLAEVVAFNGLRNLKKLDLQRNQFTIIRQGMLAGLDELLRLELHLNQIHTIEDGALDLPNLTYLGLTHNKLATLSDTVFSKIPKLEVTYVFKNELTRIGQSFYVLQHLRFLELSNNPIEDINLTEFSKMPALGSLFLSRCGISSFNTTAQNYGYAEDNKSLTHLELDDNNLTNIFELNKLNIFKGLQTLCLTRNAFNNSEKFGADDFKRIMPSLKELRWHGSGLKCTKFDMLISQLKQLNVSVRRDSCWYSPCVSCTKD